MIRSIQICLERAAAAAKEYGVSAVIYGMVEEYYDQKGKLKYTKCIAPEQNRLLSDQTELRKEIIHLEERTLYGYASNKTVRPCQNPPDGPVL